MTKRGASRAELDKLTYEQAIERLETLIERIESGEVSLEEALEQYETGMALIRRCRAILSTAEQKIAELSVNQRGELEETSDKASSPDFEAESDADERSA